MARGFTAGFGGGESNGADHVHPSARDTEPHSRPGDGGQLGSAQHTLGQARRQRDRRTPTAPHLGKGTTAGAQGSRPVLGPVLLRGSAPQPHCPQQHMRVLSTRYACPSPGRKPHTGTAVVRGARPMGARDAWVPLRVLLRVCSGGPHHKPMGWALPLSSFWSEDAETHSASSSDDCPGSVS